MNTKIYLEFFIKSKTVGGDKAKQYFFFVKREDGPPCLIVQKLVLSKDYETYKRYEFLKQFKRFGLYQQVFVIKLSTCKMVVKAFLDFFISTKMNNKS